MSSNIACSSPNETDQAIITKRDTDIKENYLVTENIIRSQRNEHAITEKYAKRMHDDIKTCTCTHVTEHVQTYLLLCT